MNSNYTALDYAQKKKKNFDQMASMHFCRSDKHRFYKNIEDFIEIVISILLCGLTFLDWKVLFTNSDYLFLTQYFPGFAGIFLFAFTFLVRNWDHSGTSKEHYIAGKMLTQAKLDIESKIEQWKIQEIDESVILQYIENHYNNLNDLPQIPENEFAKLKHEHQRKIEFSKFLDVHKESCWWCCKIKFLFNSIKFEEDSDKAPKSRTEN